MEHQKHYTREEARAILPEVRRWLKELLELHHEFEQAEKRLSDLRKEGCDLGGAVVNGWVRVIARMNNLLLEFYSREILIKDLKRGLVDFPAVIGGKEVLLCWESGEPDIEFWHDLHAGYAGRQRIEEED